MPDPMTLYGRAVEDENGCWIWQGWRDELGYARFRSGGRVHRAHRVSYELMIADIPPGLVIDHLCRVRHCINPYHMEPVPQSVNASRGNKARSLDRTHCKYGHELTPGNCREARGRRFCSTCERASSRRHYRKKKALE